MEPSFIELKVISCKSLKSFNFFQKPCVYAVGSILIDGGDDKKKKEKQQQQKTPIYRKGEDCLEWNHEMRFNLDPTAEIDRMFLQFDLVSEGLFGDKIIGEVRVPVKDLTDQFDGKVRFVTYQVRSTDGKSNGVFYFSFKVNGKEQIQSEFLPYPALSSLTDVYLPVTAPPQPPAEQMGFYPPPLPPPVERVSYYPPPPPPIYFTGPEPYGFRPVGYDYDYALCGVYGCSAVEQLQPSDHDTWRA